MRTEDRTKKRTYTKFPTGGSQLTSPVDGQAKNDTPVYYSHPNIVPISLYRIALCFERSIQRGSDRPRKIKNKIENVSNDV